MLLFHIVGTKNNLVYLVKALWAFSNHLKLDNTIVHLVPKQKDKAIDKSHNIKGGSTAIFRILKLGNKF